MSIPDGRRALASRRPLRSRLARAAQTRDTPEWQPLYCEPYNLVYSASGGSVDTVIVDGKIVMEHREVKTIDEREVIARIRELSRGVEARSGVKPPTRWPIS